MIRIFDGTTSLHTILDGIAILDGIDGSIAVVDFYAKYMDIVDKKFLDYGVSQFMIDNVPRPECSRGTNLDEYVKLRHDYLITAQNWIHSDGVKHLSYEAVVGFIKNVNNPKTRKLMNRDIIKKEKSNA